MIVLNVFSSIWVVVLGFVTCLVRSGVFFVFLDVLDVGLLAITFFYSCLFFRVLVFSVFLSMGVQSIVVWFLCKETFLNFSFLKFGLNCRKCRGMMIVMVTQGCTLGILVRAPVRGIWRTCLADMEGDDGISLNCLVWQGNLILVPWEALDT